MRRKVIIHGSKGLVHDVVRALGVKDTKLWVVKKNGRKVLQTADVDIAIGYIADETGMHKQTVREEALNGKQLIDDAQVAWTIRSESVMDVIGGTIDAENFTGAHIEELRKQLANLANIDPSSETYQKLISLLDRLSQPQLQQLSQAGIKFLSNLARNRVKRPANDGMEHFTSYRAWAQAISNKHPEAALTGTPEKQMLAIVAGRQVGIWTGSRQGPEYDRKGSGMVADAKVKDAVRRWGEAEFKRLKMEGLTARAAMRRIDEIDTEAAQLAKKYDDKSQAEWMKKRDESDNYERYARWLNGTWDAGESRDLIGKRVKFQIPGPNGPMTRVGTIREGVKPDVLEVKTQQGEFFKLHEIGQYQVV